MTKPNDGNATEITTAEAAIIAEAAYRRGFQQGYESRERGDALAVDLARWRFWTRLDIAVSPHGHPATTAEERMLVERAAAGPGRRARRGE